MHYVYTAAVGRDVVCNCLARGKEHEPPSEKKNNMRFTIKTIEESKQILKHFNEFHDGFIKSVKIISNTKFVQEMPWEPSPIFKNNEEVLDNTGQMIGNQNGIFINICHYNYEYPNRLPTNVIKVYISESEVEDSSFFKYVGSSIISLKINQTMKDRLLIEFNLEIYDNEKTQIINVKAITGKMIYIREDDI